VGVATIRKQMLGSLTAATDVGRGIDWEPSDREAKIISSGCTALLDVQVILVDPVPVTAGGHQGEYLYVLGSIFACSGPGPLQGCRGLLAITLLTSGYAASKCFLEEARETPPHSASAPVAGEAGALGERVSGRTGDFRCCG
jgi:hypothetical protein